MTQRRNDIPILTLNDESLPIVGADGAPVLSFYDLLQELIARVPIYGSGDPNGQYEAQQGTLYVDINGAQGQRGWMKTTEGGNAGWEPL